MSSNDIEYLPGWDKELLTKFDIFPELGQLSLYSPFPQMEIGQVGSRVQDSRSITRNGQTIYLAEINVPSVSILRREVWDSGVRWETRKVIGDTTRRLPADGLFSKAVKESGYWVAWNDKYTVINWGHNVSEWIKDPEYYLGNFRAKPQIGEEGMKKMLQELGYDLVQDSGKYKIVKL
jgi:hypothetical protein